MITITEPARGFCKRCIKSYERLVRDDCGGLAAILAYREERGRTHLVWSPSSQKGTLCGHFSAPGWARR